MIENSPQNRRRLFIIANTTHFLNVSTYIDSHPPAENFIVLTIRRFKGFKEFVEKVKTNPNLKLLKVIFVDQKNKPPFHYIDIFSTIGAVKWMALKQSSFDEILFTNYNSWIQHYILEQYKPIKIILISDGTGIFSVASLRKNKKDIPFEGSNFFINKVLALSPIQNITYYSPWKLDVSSSDAVEVFSFKSSASNLIRSNKIYFVGSPLIELGYLEKQTHINFLQKVKKQFKNSDFFYFSHRREKKENLKDYEFFGKIIRDNIPFEERMEKEEELPGIVISYISSILINLPQIYPQVKFYYRSLEKNDLDLDAEFKKRYKELAENFKNMKRDNFKELKFKK